MGGARRGFAWNAGRYQAPGGLCGGQVRAGQNQGQASEGSGMKTLAEEPQAVQDGEGRGEVAGSDRNLGSAAGEARCLTDLLTGQAGARGCGEDFTGLPDIGL
jgi:hypothetical protein